MKDRITIGFCSMDLEKDKDFIKNMSDTCGLGVDIISKVGYTSISKAYNEILSESKNELVVLCHNDIKMHTDGWGVIIKELFDKYKQYGIIGIVGSNGWTGESWLGTNGAQAIGVLRQFQKYDIMKGVRPRWCLFSPLFRVNDIVPATTVDGLFMAISKSRIKAPFDENLTGFHFYDVMFAVDNVIKGCHVGITYKLDISHYSDGIYSKQWYEARDYSRSKYGASVSYGTELPSGGSPVLYKYKNEEDLQNYKNMIGYE